MTNVVSLGFCSQGSNRHNFRTNCNYYTVVYANLNIDPRRKPNGRNLLIHSNDAFSSVILFSRFTYRFIQSTPQLTSLR